MAAQYREALAIGDDPKAIKQNAARTLTFGEYSQLDRRGWMHHRTGTVCSPPRADRIDAAMAGWEEHIHADAPDRLVQLAIVHAEFEAIHPFLDGNGRIGRLIIPLFLYDHGLLSRPNFYLSEYLEANRGEYYDRTLAVSRDDDWSGWVAFFLRGIVAQADANTKRRRPF